MKKTLLLSAAFAVSCLAFAQEAFTSYDYSAGCNVVPTGRNQGANVPAGSFYSFNGESEFAKHGGLIVASGGQWANDAQPYWENLMSGCSFVDLGGEVGRVLCLYGPKSTEEDDLEYDFNTVYGTKIPMSKGGINWGNLNFFCNPATQPKAANGVKDMAEMPTHIRVEMIINIYSQVGASAPYFNTIYSVDDQNNVKPTQGVCNAAAGASINVEEFFDADTYEWNADKWLKYEFDTYTIGTDDKGVQYAPMHLKMEMNGGAWAGNVCFIKSIKFYEVEDVVMNGDEGRSRTWLTLAPDLNNIKVEGGEDGIGSVAATGNTQTYDLAGRKVNVAAHGLYIQNGKKFVK